MKTWARREADKKTHHDEGVAGTGGGEYHALMFSTEKKCIKGRSGEITGAVLNLFSQPWEFHF